MKNAVTAHVLWGETVLRVIALDRDGEVTAAALGLPIADTCVAHVEGDGVVVGETELAVGDVTAVELGVFSVVIERHAQVSLPASRRRVPALARSTLGSIALHASLLASLAYALPPLDTEIIAVDRETAAYLRTRSSVNEPEVVTPAPVVLNEHRRASGWDDGARHAGASGQLGRLDLPRRDTYFMVRGGDDRTAIARAQIESASYGALSVLSAVLAHASAPAEFEGSAASTLGSDPRSFIGALDGASPGDSFGALGLGLLGDSAGGSGLEVGLGLGSGGTGWGGCGCGSMGSLGHGHGHGTGYGRVIERSETIVGSLPKDAVRRVVRANFPRFRRCYDDALKKDPSAAGTVTTRFIIDQTGAVETASLAGGTLANEAVRACVLAVYSTLSFPEPSGGKVLVTYPIDFEAE